MRVALVHEFLNQLGGAERVLENFLEIWPEATVHVIFYDKKKTNGKFEGFNKKVSWVNSLPLKSSHPRLFLPLMPFAVGNFQLDDFDVVLSDSSAFAKGARTKKLHICYCHAPTRYLWSYPEYIDNQKYPKPLIWFGKIFLRWLKKWDFQAAQKPDFFIANSRNIQTQIKNYYKRDSDVIFPPVDTQKFFPEGSKKDYFFTASRLEPYKKIDVIIEAFNHLGLPLKIAGTGTDQDRLKKLAGENIEFVGAVSDEELRRYYSEARAYIFAAEEDAGIMVVEAQSCGTPVIAYGKGGALETVVAGVTGEFFLQQNSESLIGVLKSFEGAKYDSQKIREHAMQFDKKIFQQKIKKYIEEKYANRN